MSAGVTAMEADVAVGEGLEIGVEFAVRTRDVDVGLAVPPTTPPHPMKENTIRGKQISERVPEAQNESWRRIDYLSAI